MAMYFREISARDSFIKDEESGPPIIKLTREVEDNTRVKGFPERYKVVLNCSTWNNNTVDSYCDDDEDFKSAVSLINIIFLFR